MISKRRKLYMYRKNNHLCVNCGEKTDGGTVTRCIRCAQIERIKANERYAKLSPEEKNKKYQQQQEWRRNNPQKVAKYAERKTEYNRRYKEKYEW